MITKRLKQHMAEHQEYKFILSLFLATRIVLTGIGLSARAFIQSPHNFVYSKYTWLAIWGVWDSGWYLPLAKYGYSSIISTRLSTLGQANYAFFPLYPLLMKILELIVRDYYIAGLLIANISLLIACVYLYKLARLDFEHDVAIRTTQYCLLWPVAFIFSGVFTESLYLALAIVSFYYARKNNWLLACILGFFLALTRSIGVLIIIPLMYEIIKMRLLPEEQTIDHLSPPVSSRAVASERRDPSAHPQMHSDSLGMTMKKNSFYFKNIGKEIFYFLLIPAGLALFAFYNYFLTKDPLAFLKIQSSWGRSLVNPIRLIWGGLFYGDATSIFNVLFTLLVIALVIFFYKKIRASYLIFIAYSILVPLLSGLESMPRYTLVIFPLFILLAQVTKNKYINYSLVASLFLAQCVLMVFWTTGFNLVK